jgi:predicted RNA binding protein YcfA (HicA-like mRNA interferase family)
MSRIEKLILRILSGNSDSNIGFSELCNLLDYIGFQVRIKGDHYIYFMDSIDEIINLKPVGNKAKTYQVKQVRNIILKYKLFRDVYE